MVYIVVATNAKKTRKIKVTMKKFRDYWNEIEQIYCSSQVLDISEGDGSPSDLIWGEFDFQYHLAKILEKHFTDKSVHLEVNGITPYNRIDIVICDKQPWKQIIKEGRKLDIVIETAVIINTSTKAKNNYYNGEPNYNIPKLLKNAETLSKILVNGKSKSAALCVINKVPFADRQDYDSLKKKHPMVDIFAIHDNELKIKKP